MRESVWVRLLEKLDKQTGAKFLSKEIYCLLRDRLKIEKQRDRKIDR